MQWFEAVEQIRPSVVQITSPAGSGTGFLIARAKSLTICGVATAAHVVNQAHYWEQPIRIQQADSMATDLLRHSDRAIILDEQRDTAIIIFEPKQIVFPQSPIPLIDEGRYLKIGNSIGWLGYPAIGSPHLCFFTGAVSAWVQEQSAYFVDGVAINGVSGGPAFTLIQNEIRVIGVVSAYMPNRITGETLPGLGIVRDVAQFHDMTRRFQSVDDAKAEETPPTTPPPAPHPGVPPMQDAF